MSEGVKGPWTQQELQFKEDLTAMAKQPENLECADCTSKAPRWAAFNHGIFICIKCAGQHRNLGTDISQVRSINIDRWKQHQFDSMVGNDKANEELLFNLPSDLHKPDENDDYARLKWIENKYVKRKWAKKDNQEQKQIVEQTPPPAQTQSPSAAVVNVVAPPAVVKVAVQQQVIQVQPVKQEDDLLDIFGMNQKQPTPPAIVQPVVVVPVQPAPIIAAPIIKQVAPVIPQPKPVAKPITQQQVQYQQQVQKKDEFSDIMNMLDKPKEQEKPAEDKTTAPAQQKKGFDVASFINQNKPQQAGSKDYKPSGFDW